jgi:hypothetical protein
MTGRALVMTVVMVVKMGQMQEATGAWGYGSGDGSDVRNDWREDSHLPSYISRLKPNSPTVPILIWRLSGAYPATVRNSGNNNNMAPELACHVLDRHEKPSQTRRCFGNDNMVSI